MQNNTKQTTYLKLRHPRCVRYNKMVQDDRNKTRLISCVLTVPSCIILLYVTQRGCRNLRLLMPVKAISISCVLTVLSCTILLYQTQRGCHNLRFPDSQLKILLCCSSLPTSSTFSLPAAKLYTLNTNTFLMFCASPFYCSINFW